MSVSDDMVIQERKEILALVEELIEYPHQMPCPDGKRGCCVLHTVKWKRRRTAEEIAYAIRAR